MPKKDILGTEFKKTIVKLRINTLGYICVPSFILKNLFEVSGLNMSKIGILGTEFKKRIVKFRMSTLEYTYVPRLI